MFPILATKVTRNEPQLMPKFTLVLIGFVFLNFTALAQEKSADYFYKLYQKATSVKEKGEVSVDFIDSDGSYQTLDTFFLNRHQNLLKEASKARNVQVTNVARLSLAMNYAAGQKVEESLSFLNRIGIYFYESNELRLHYHTIQTLARVLMLKGSYKEGLDQVKLLESLKPKLRGWNNVVLINELKGYALQNLDKYKAAEKCYKEYISDAERIGKTRIIANAYARLGELYQNNERYDEAEVNFIKSAEAALKTGNQTQVGSAKTSLAIIEYYRGNFESAQSLFEEAYTVQKNSGKTLSICDALFNLGVFYFEKGDLQKAIEPYTEMLRIAEENKLEEKKIEVLLEFAHLYDSLRNYPQPIRYYERYIEANSNFQMNEMDKSDKFNSNYAAITLFEQQRITANLQTTLDQAKLRSVLFALGFFLVTGMFGMLLLNKWMKKRNALNSIGEG